MSDQLEIIKYENVIILTGGESMRTRNMLNPKENDSLARSEPV